MNMTPKIRFDKFIDEWEHRKFSDLAITRRGLTYKPSNIEEVGIRVLRSLNISEDQFVYSEDDVFVEPAAVNIPFVCEGDILITSANGSTRLVGKHAIIKGLPMNSAVHGGFMLLATAKNFEFVNALMSAPWYSKYISLHAAGGNGAIGNISKKDLDEQSVLVPIDTEDVEQRAIGRFFINLDNLIILQQQKYNKLISLKAACLDKMFPKKGSKVPEMRFVGFVGDWEQRRIGEFDVKTGPFGSTLHADDYVSDGTPIVTTEHFKNGELPLTGEGIPQVSLADAERLKQYELEEHDIVFSRVGSVDLNAEVLKNQVGWLFSGRVLRVRPDNTIDSTFLHYELGTRRVRHSIIDRSVGLAMASINTSILKDTLFYAPETINEQKAIGNCLRQLDKQITLNQRKLEKLKQLKQAMLHKMFV